ncbi:MAG: hypothetical protein AAF579_11850 [Cyanobacteria bacterium P01_C01_bin.118]
MELQTIRQKLQTLKASPPEPVSVPWSQPQLAAPSPNLAQVTTAIETLRQRSHQPVTASTTDVSMQQFDAALSTIENLAQQQQQALQHLQTLGDSLAQQVPPGNSPEVDHIVRFLTECPIVQIPTVQRDRGGYLDLVYRTINFNQATPPTNQLFKAPLKQSQKLDIGFDESPYEETGGILEEFGYFCRWVYRSMQQWLGQYSPTFQGPRPPQLHTSQFTLVDGAIWCIGAAILRIVLNQLFRLYPPLWTPVACILIGGIILSLYRAIFGSRPNPVLGYRTLMMILGLLLGGRFS